MDSGKFNLTLVFLRKFIPKKLFPGKNRKLSDYPLKIPKNINFFNGIDWTLVPSLIKAIKFIKQENVNIILLQWWSSSVLSIYLALMYLIKIFRLKTKIIIEVHEFFDPKEQMNPFLNVYVKMLSPLIFNSASFIIFHSNKELNNISSKIRSDSSKFVVMNHIATQTKVLIRTDKQNNNVNQDKPIILLYFGLIRHYKGVINLIKAFEEMKKSLTFTQDIQLHVIGEIWEEKHTIYSLVKNSLFASSITLIDKYIPDKEIPLIFGNADCVVLPYLRGTQSGVLHLAMYYGKPIIISDVGGFSESLKNYKPKFFIKPDNILNLTNTMKNIIEMIIKNEINSFTNNREFLREKNARYVKKLNQLVSELESST